MKITIFPSVTQTQGREINLPWEEFVNQYLKEFDPRTTKDGPLYSFANYEGTPKRADVNVVGLSGAILDFDNSDGVGATARCIASPTIPDDVETELHGLTYAVHSSFSNSESWPKWRLAIPFDRTVKPHEWRAVFEGLLFKLGGLDGIDPSCGDLSRSYWLPSCPPNMLGVAFSRYYEGALISSDELIENSGIVVTESAGPSTNLQVGHGSNGSGNTDYSKEKSTNGSKQALGRNNHLKAVIAAMLERGEPIPKILEEILREDQKHNPPLFTDTSEGYNFGAEAGAMRFLSSIVKSINTTRVNNGKDPIVSGNLEGERNAKVGGQPFTGFTPLPEKFFQAPGLVGETYQYIVSSSIKPQPELALAAAFAACGTVMGRKIRTETNLRTALYFLSLIETGGGKDWPRKAIQRIFNSIGRYDRAETEDVTSDVAIFEALARCPSQVLLLDEFGRWLKAAGSPLHNQNLYAVPGALLRLFGSAGGPFMGKSYASRTNNRLIQQPNLSLLATSVERHFYEAITSAAVEDGLLNRMIFLPSQDPDPMMRNVRNFDPPETLIEQFRAWEELGYRQDGNLATLEAAEGLPPEPREVPYTKEAAEIFVQFEKDLWNRRAALRKDGFAGLFTRAADNAKRVALVLAGGQDIVSPRITEADALYATTFVLTCVENMLLAVKHHVSDTKLETQQKSVLRVIREAGENGVTLHEIGRRTKSLLRKKEREEILDDLESMGFVSKNVDYSASKRPKTFYYYLGEGNEH
jgi:hypothetical protein